MRQVCAPCSCTRPRHGLVPMARWGTMAAPPWAGPRQVPVAGLRLRAAGGHGAEVGVVRAPAASPEACFCKPQLPRPLCLLPQVIAAKRMGSVCAVTFGLAGRCRTGLAGRHPDKATAVGLLLSPREAAPVLKAGWFSELDQRCWARAEAPNRCLMKFPYSK